MDITPFEKWESEVRGYCRAYPTVFTSASNARQLDEAGKSYIDFFAGAGALPFGHNNPRMKRAMIEFLESDGVAQSLDLFTPEKREFVSRFAEVILEPRNMDHKMQFVGPTGTNAVEAALKLARRVTGRHNVVAFGHGFHGMTLGALAATANDQFRRAAGVPLLNIDRLPAESSVGGGLESIEAYAAALEDSSSGLKPPAAFLVEVIQAEGGVYPASEAWLQAVQQLARKVGALFIIDDIQASVGRTGSYFSFDDMDIDPDIVTLAKGIGGYGTPLAMNLNRPEYDAHWLPGEHTGTFRGQGLSFVAGTVALSYFLDDEFTAQVRSHGEVIRSRLDAIVAANPQRGWESRGRGMLQGIDLADGGLVRKIQAAAYENGLLFGPCGTGGRVIKLIPPLTIPREDLDEGLDILDDAISSVVGAP